MVIFRLVKAYFKGEYKKIPLKSLFLTIASIIYFIMPVDITPDFIAGFGLIDDVALLAWALKSIKSDIDDFRKWERD